MDPGVPRRTKTPETLMTPHSVVNPAALGEEVEEKLQLLGVKALSKAVEASCLTELACLRSYGQWFTGLIKSHW